mgnify:CR=1 FL=1
MKLIAKYYINNHKIYSENSQLISQVQKNLKAIREGLQLRKGTTVIPYSAETKQGREEIWDLVDQILASSGETDEE